MTVRLLAVCPLALLVACGSDSKKTGPGPGGAPSASMAATPLTGDAPLDVQFNCNVTGGDAPLSFDFDFGDGTNAAVQGPMHTFTAAGTYIVTCQVTDADGESDSTQAQITVTGAGSGSGSGHAPHGVLDVLNTSKPNCAVTGQTTVQMSAANSTDPDNDTLWYEWTLISAPAGSTAALATQIGVATSFAPDVDGAYLIRMHVSDPGGLADNIDLTVTSESASQIVIVSGDNQTSPGGGALASSLTFALQTQCGLGVTGQSINFSATTGTVSPTAATTDSNGQVTTSATIGCQLGTGMVTAVWSNNSAITAAASYNATLGPAYAVVLQKPTSVQVPGPMSVRAEVHDQCSNLVTTDNTTAFTLTLAESTADATAMFTAVTTGTAVDTTNPAAWIIRVAGGVAVVTLGDSAADTITFNMVDSQSTGLNFFGGSGTNYDVTQTAVPISCNGGTINVNFTGLPQPQGTGTITISGQIDSDDSTEYLYVYADSNYLGTTFGTQPDCYQQTGSVTASQSTLASAAADGTITVAITTGSAVDCFCADTIDVELTFPSVTTADFTP